MEKEKKRERQKERERERERDDTEDRDREREKKRERENTSRNGVQIDYYPSILFLISASNSNPKAKIQLATEVCVHACIFGVQKN